MKGQKLPASMTVETSYVMAIVILALSVMIQTAYRQCKKTTEVRKLHQLVEQVCYEETEQSHSLLNGEVSSNSKEVEGYIQIDSWNKQITVQVHEPEEFLRKMTVLEWVMK